MAEEISKKKVVYSMPGMDAIRVDSDGVIDLYAPASDASAAVVIVSGYPDAGFERFVGCKFKDMASSISWARLIAASGIAAATYSAADPTAGLAMVLGRLRERSFRRVGLLASSGNAPVALSQLLRVSANPIMYAALCYPYTFRVPAAAKKFGFATPGDDRSVADLPADVPLLLARAGRDEMPGLNETLDDFVAAAIRRNLPITLLNHHTGPHAFDVVDDTPATLAVILQVLAFLRAHTA